MNLFTFYFCSPRFIWLRARSCGGQLPHRLLSIPPLFAVHSKRGIIDFLRSTPSFVREYSTRGGISAKDSLLIKPSAWSSFSVSDRVLGLMPCRVCINLLNLSFPWLPNVLMIKSAHFLLIRSITPFRGQMQVCCSLLFIIVTFFEDSNYITINLIV